MRSFSRTSQFKKDIKRIAKQGFDLRKLRLILDLLLDGKPLPSRCKDHPLQGDFAGSRDCHIEPDWLLIYTLTEASRSQRNVHKTFPQSLFVLVLW